MLLKALSTNGQLGDYVKHILPRNTRTHSPDGCSGTPRSPRHVRDIRAERPIGPHRLDVLYQAGCLMGPGPWRTRPGASGRGLAVNHPRNRPDIVSGINRLASHPTVRLHVGGRWCVPAAVDDQSLHRLAPPLGATWELSRILPLLCGINPMGTEVCVPKNSVNHLPGGLFPAQCGGTLRGDRAIRSCN